MENVKGYVLVNPEKVDRAINGTQTGNGTKLGGVVKEDGSYDESALLAEYDKIGGLIRDEEGNQVKIGSFYDFKNKKPRAKPEVVLLFNVNGEVVEVPEGGKVPKIVEAVKVLDERKATKAAERAAKKAAKAGK